MFRRFGEGCEDLEDDPRTQEPPTAEIRKRLPSMYKVSQRTMNDTKWWRFQDVEDIICMEFAKTEHAAFIGCEDNLSATFITLCWNGGTLLWAKTKQPSFCFMCPRLPAVNRTFIIRRRYAVHRSLWTKTLQHAEETLTAQQSHFCKCSYYKSRDNESH